MRKQKVLGVLIACGLMATMATSAFAADAPVTLTDPNGQVGGTIPTGNGTDVYAGVAVDEPDARIKVTVPTLFAFVVNGTVDNTEGAKAVTLENNGLLMPNVKVTNANSTADPQTYKIETVGDASELQFENYSTWINNENTREGMEVKITGSIKNEGTEASRSGWTHVAKDPASTAKTDLKKYRIGVAVDANDANSDGTIADAEYTWFEDLGDGNHGIKSANAITLAAPSGVTDSTNIDATTKLAVSPSYTPMYFNVKVGGTRGDYVKVENSAKVGTITWSVSTPQIESDKK